MALHMVHDQKEYMEGEMVTNMASIKSGRKTMASSSTLPVRWEHERLEGVGACQRLDTRRHQRWQVYRFGPQNRERVRWGRLAVAEGTWRHRKACVEAKRSREGDVSVRCSQKKMNHFVPVWACIVVNRLEIF